MISIFFSRIPRCLFEPLAVCAVLGIILALWLCRKKQDRMFWLVSCSLFFMIFWRVGVEIVSGRYASILIYPTVILVSYFCFHLKELPGMTKVPEKFQYFLPWCLLLIATGISIGKDLRFNHYEEYLRKCADIARLDSMHFQHPLALTYGTEVKRIGYYSNLTTLFYGKGTKIDWNADEISDILKRYRYFGDALYLFIDEKGKAPLIMAEALGVSEQEWSMLASCFQNNHRRKRLTLYRYLPDTIPWKMATKADIEQFQQRDSKEVLFNGHFGQIEEKSRFRSVLKMLQQRGLIFFTKPDWQFPAGWAFELDRRIVAKSATEVELYSPGIVGKYALRLAGDHRFMVFTREMFPKGQYELNFLIRGRSGTHFGISFHTYDETGKYVAFREMAHCRLLSDDNYLYRFKITEQDIGEGVQFRLCLVLYEGETFWEKVSLLPTIRNGDRE